MSTATKMTDLAPTQTDWKRLRSMTEEDIIGAVADDPDAAPIPTAEEMKLYKPTPARIKRPRASSVKPNLGGLPAWV